MDPDPTAGRLAGATMNAEAARRARTSASDVVDAIGDVRIVPVLTIDDVADAPDLVAALLAGRLPVAEITLRTPVGIEAIRRVAADVPAAIVGAGSVTTAGAAATAIDAGAQFIVSPGLDEGVITTAHDRGVPAIPGIATPTELMRALALGVNVVKLFPAEVVGGVEMIAALSAVWPEVRFMPTGGISLANAPRFLAIEQVLAVGGTWMVDRSAVASRDWASVTAAASAAAALAEVST
ncbi:MAG TPA: bifunctional 4-hydroxy-2-oxoglutarate aldolase/2-dehydro-3-deoxy-phosphogluconate aldolase [Ilumatobacteraceae bacterium]|nr:bifunctional 4-hydroxy-2-oxoglutarate aldolase/2-dehydro-3-deoxy-phosphogluconate aldolase [Ilumatobacteraceae bacterium]